MYCNNNNTSAQLPTVYSYVQCQSEGKASSRCVYCSDWMWPTEVSSASSVLASFPIHSAPWDKADILQQYAAMQCYAVIEDKSMLQSEDDGGVMERWWWWHDCWMIGCGENGMVELSPSVLWSHVWQCAGYSISWQWSPTLTARNWFLQMCKDYTCLISR